MTPNKLPPLPECWTGSPVTVTWKEDGETTNREVYTADQMHAYAALALRQSQSLPAGAVSDFTERHALDLRSITVGEVLTQEQWHAVCAFVRDQEAIIDALQADAREKGEAD